MVTHVAVNCSGILNLATGFEVAGIQLAGRNPEAFHIETNTCTDIIVAANEQCEIMLTRSGEDSAVAIAVVDFNDGAFPRVIELIARDVAPSLSFDPDTPRL